MHLILGIVISAVWKVTITTGVYEPAQGSDAVEGSDNTGNQTAGDHLENSADQTTALDAELNDDMQDSNEENLANTNNNAYEIDYSVLKSAKYKVAPKPPTCQILVVLYGDKGQTPVLPLECCSPGGVCSFLPGCADDFRVMN